MRSTYSITEAAKRLDVSVRAIRFYEEKGLVRPQRSGSARVYADTDLDQLRFVIDARKWRFSISEIARVLANCRQNRPPALPLELIKAQRDVLVSERAELDGIIGGLDAAVASRLPDRACRA